MDNETLATTYEGYKEFVNHAMDEGHEIAAALGFLAQAVDDMTHNDRKWSVGALVLLLRALEKQARDLDHIWTKRVRPEAPSPRQRKAQCGTSRMPLLRCGATECASFANIPSLPGKWRTLSSAVPTPAYFNRHRPSLPPCFRGVKNLKWGQCGDKKPTNRKRAYGNSP